MICSADCIYILHMMTNTKVYLQKKSKKLNIKKQTKYNSKTKKSRRRGTIGECKIHSKTDLGREDRRERESLLFL